MEARRAAKSTADPATAGHRPMSKNEQNRRLKKIAAAEERILELETEKEAVVATMGAGGVDAAELQRLGRRCADIDAEVEKLMADWETWEQEISEGAEPE